MIVIHGENTIQSRNKLVELLDQAKAKNVLVERLMATQLDLPTLESKLQKTDLFGHNRMLVIEELHSQTRSKKQTALIEMLATTSTDIILWEKRQLTQTMLKKLKADKVYEFKLANSLFNWLDSLSPASAGSSKTQQLQLLEQAVKENDEYMCFIMLARQLRLLIQAKTGGEVKGPYFVVNKINKQARQFSLSQLLSLHQQLYKLDGQLKTSTNQLSLKQTIEFMIYNL